MNKQPGLLKNKIFPKTAKLTAIVAFALILTARDRLSAEMKTVEYFGMCDASAAVAVGNDMFLAANDEDNILRLYRTNQGGKPVQSFNLNRFLKIPKRREADIEAAAQVGNIVYWITSHGTNKNGKPRPGRRRLFATGIKQSGGEVEVRPIGVPHKNLLEALKKSPQLKKFGFGTAAKIPPKREGGLNIEGLAPAEGGGLLIGFRNPAAGEDALIVPLENPEEVINGKEAKLGDATVLPLGGFGIRAIEYLSGRREYLIVAGARDGREVFQIYKWAGYGRPEPAARIDTTGLNPEAAVFYAEKGGMLFLSDGGSKNVAGEKCKDSPASKRSFRGILVPY